MESQQNKIISVENITVDFGNFRALDNVNAEINTGDLDGTGNLYRIQANVSHERMARVMESFLYRIQKDIAEGK